MMEGKAREKANVDTQKKLLLLLTWYLKQQGRGDLARV